MELGPNEIKQMLYQQIGFFQEKEKKKPNCCMLGIKIVEILDAVNAFNWDEEKNENFFEGLKIYLDGDNECAINVGYNPFRSGSRC